MIVLTLSVFVHAGYSRLFPILTLIILGRLHRFMQCFMECGPIVLLIHALGLDLMSVELSRLPSLLIFRRYKLEYFTRFLLQLLHSVKLLQIASQTGPHRTTALVLCFPCVTLLRKLDIGLVEMSAGQEELVQ